MARNTVIHKVFKVFASDIREKYGLLAETHPREEAAVLCVKRAGNSAFESFKCSVHLNRELTYRMYIAPKVAQHKIDMISVIDACKLLKVEMPANYQLPPFGGAQQLVFSLDEPHSLEMAWAWITANLDIWYATCQKNPVSAKSRRRSRQRK